MSINFARHQLLAFLTVAEEQSFTKAAIRLSVSQPALSRTIRLMEDIIGTRLFDRDTRNVTLTPVGDELLAHARRTLAELESLSGQLSAFVDGRRGRVTVAALPSIAAVLLPKAIAAFAQSAPEVDIRIREGLSERIVQAVEAGDADFGVTVQSESGGRLVHEELCADEFGVVARKDDPLLSLKSVNWSVFAERPFIAMAPDSSVRKMTDAAFLQLAMQVEPLYECSSLGTTGNLVAAGLGIAALPRLTCALTGSGDLTWRVLNAPRVRRTIGIVTRPGRAASPATLAFLNLVRKTAKEL